MFVAVEMISYLVTLSMVTDDKATIEGYIEIMFQFLKVFFPVE